MFRKFSTTKLVLILVLLLVIVLALEYYEDKTQSGTFKKELVSIDTGKVSSFVVYPKSKNPKEIHLLKKDNKWFVQLPDNKLVNADESNINQSLATLLNIKPSNLAANDPSKWNEFQVDSSGTRVKVFEGEINTLDLILGRFSFKSQREMYSYIRLADENEVYSVEGMLDMSFNRVFDYWRDPIILNGKRDEWKKLSFNYPADSSFSLTKKANNWLLDDITNPDSAVLDKFLGQLEYINHSQFADDVKESSLENPLLNLTIETNSGSSIIINAFAHEKYEWVITSNLNIGTVFSSKKDELFDKLFPSKTKLAIADTIKVVGSS